MTEESRSDAPISLILIHRVLSRGMEVGLQHTATYAREGYPDAATGEGLGIYLRTLAGVLHVHHSAEDEIAFPFLRERLADLPLDLLAADHVQMAAILEEMAPSLERLQGESGEGPALEAVHEALARLAAIWPGHIGIEETKFSMKRLEAVASAEEVGGWLQEMGQHRPEGSPPDPLMMPFILYNLSAQDRAIISQALPPVVTQELVPLVWKEQWAPMVPFLLA